MSALNCKPGDLAIVVKSCAGNEGKIVRCIKLAGNINYTLPNGVARGYVAWEIDRALPDWTGNVNDTTFPDAYLRPIRPLDELDDITRDEEVTA